MTIDKRINYAWGGPGGKSPGTSSSGGARGGGDGGHHRDDPVTQSFPVYQAPVTQVTTAKAPPRILSRPTPSTTIGPSLHGDTSEQKVADELNRKKAIRDIIKQGQEEKFGPTADPTKFGETVAPRDLRTEREKEEDVERATDWDKVKKLSKKGYGFEEIQSAMDKGLLTKADPQSMKTGLLDRGLRSLRNIIPGTGLERSLLGGLKKSFAPIEGGQFSLKNMASNFAKQKMKTMALQKLGLGAAVPWLGLLSFLPQLFGQKGMFASKPKDMSAFNKLELFNKRIPTQKADIPQRVGQDTTAKKIATGEVDLNKLITGRSDISPEFQHLVKFAGAKVTDRNEMKKNAQKFVDMYKEGKYDNLDQAIRDADRYNAGEETHYEQTTGKPLPKIFSEKLQEGVEAYGENVSESQKRQQELLKEIGVAHGGRIDRPLMGRSRDI